MNTQYSNEIGISYYDLFEEENPYITPPDWSEVLNEDTLFSEINSIFNAKSSESDTELLNHLDQWRINSPLPNESDLNDYQKKLLKNSLTFLLAHKMKAKLLPGPEIDNELYKKFKKIIFDIVKLVDSSDRQKKCLLLLTYILNLDSKAPALQKDFSKYLALQYNAKIPLGS